MKPYPILALWLLFMACSGSDSVLGPTPSSGTYSYTGRDASGAEVARGWIKITVQGDTQIGGQWHLESVGTASGGPTLGDGQLQGTVEKESVQINLNPQNADNNLLLSGAIREGQLEGQWSWVTIAGVSKTGTFVAVKQ